MYPNFGFKWQDLYDSKKLADLHQKFLANLQSLDPELYAQVYQTSKTPSDYLIPLAMAIESFIVELFKLDSHLQRHYDAHHRYRLASHFKRNFIQRDVLHTYKSAKGIDGNSILESLSEKLGQTFDPTDEVTFAHLGLAALNRSDQAVIDLFRQYVAWAVYSDDGKQRHQIGFLFKTPAVTDPQERFPINKELGTIVSPSVASRNGFDLTDQGIDTAHAVDEAFYCIKCHERNKDSCRTGFKVNEESFKKDVHGQPMSGCPLDQKISEMNILFEHGQIIAALAVVTLDNPMVAATGHRICYDCSRSCIFQKQDAVDIPSVETRLLKQVLSLPYGFEIYSLLTRWNPLNLEVPFPKTDSGYKILIVGQGPAGFALAHLMMQYGHKVTAIDGLKIEPLTSDLKDPSIPIKDISEYYEVLSKRYAKGFGGVAEYGITARWDKNFLFIIRLLLERRSLYQYLDGVRFGSSITVNDAFNIHGFDHIALCLGAGSPAMLPLANVTIPGVRLASDFLMTLHLGDAAKYDSRTTLRLQLPIAVIGAGLTAVDTATEASAYYPVQVMNFYLRYQQLIQQYGPEKTAEVLNVDSEVSGIFLQHGQVIHKEFVHAQSEGRQPNYLPYLKEWGGVTIYYRDRMQNASSYRLNPYELKNALEEGIGFVEHATPTNLLSGEDGRLSAVEFNIDNQVNTIPIKTLLIAAGTKPNTVLARELPGLELSGHFFKPIDNHPFFVSETPDNRYVSYLGDLHPKYSGSVVKALASAKTASPLIHAALAQSPPKEHLFNSNDFISTVDHISVDNHTVHLSIHSMAAAQAYKPGQFFKLHPYGSGHTESIPAFPAAICSETGKIDFKIQIVGASTRLLQKIEIKQRIFVMGPIGSELNIPFDHKVLFIVDSVLSTDLLTPIMKHLPNPAHQIITEIEHISSNDFHGFDCVFIVGQGDFIEGFTRQYKHVSLPCYTFVYTQLQCMMKAVCARCVYTIQDPTNGSTAIQFGCAKSIESIQKISYPSINKRNKNERLEEVILDHLFIS